MEVFCTSFPPVLAKDARVLVLGTMPGVASLRAEQYYAHPRNAFWPILFALWDAQAPVDDYAKRIAFAMAHRIAIWDVAQTCLRAGSSDASIREVIPNDFRALFAQAPGIHTIFHNGQLSWSLFDKWVVSAGNANAGRGHRRVVLPSTSPAYTLPYLEKLAAWRIVRTAAEKENTDDAEYARTDFEKT